MPADTPGPNGPNGPDEDNCFSRAKNWARTNPLQAAALGGSAIVVAAPAIVAAPVLAIAGFGANGIVGGSIAAGIQSGMGSVAAGSLFATLQSAGAAGYGLAAVHGAVQATAIMGAFRAWFGGSEPDGDIGEEGNALLLVEDVDACDDDDGTDDRGPVISVPVPKEPGSDDKVPEKEGETEDNGKRAEAMGKL
ncbi:hypothetical protein AK830_g8803 [Neonectria ditissima]|uniref:Uncharacterized protein n=1 Tax=Neonectria ditissima TaxID=78410 RepID=A0A0P7BAI6_9HYPO|nr:hypothetical protein AK830_g8803 [Neonectria ditissima]